MIEWIDANTEDAVALLEATVNISSGSNNHEGVREVGRVMRSELDALGLDTVWIDQSDVQRAGHLFGSSKPGSGKKFLLIGHLDTVFEADDEFRSFERDGDTATGPGVDDMKSGNVVIVYALKALQHAGVFDDIQVVVAYTGDEERTGKPVSVSRKDLVDAGKWADYSMGFESAISYDGTDWATIARRSSGGWQVTVSGKQAHSSGIFSDETGAGAIFEAARILDDFYEEVRGEEYVTFNAGTILGGTDVEYDELQSRGTAFGKSNVVPGTVVINGGMRCITLEQIEQTKQAMRDVVSRNLPHTSAAIRFTDSYPPMAPTPGNHRMYEKLSEINLALGRGPMKTLDPSRRGAADISFVSPYSDALAGLGALGSGGHSPRETLDLTSMPLAIKRAALLIYRLGREQETE
jgi:glutamate carboxypeptidase